MRYQIDSSKFLSKSEKEKLLESLETNVTERDRLLIELSLATGARASEILSLTKRSLNHEALSVFIEGLKGSDNRELPIRKALFLRLSKYAASLQGDCLFDISLRRFEMIWEDLRPVKKALKSLRHTFAIELYERRRDLRLVQVALGHRNINNTIVYADYHFKSSELRKLIC